MKKNSVLAVMKSIYVKHKNLTLAIVAGVLVPAVLFAATYVAPQQGSQASTVINCQAEGSCNIVVAAPTPTEPSIGTGEGTFGAPTRAFEVTRWISGEFTSNLAVLGETTLTGTTTFSGEVAGVVKSIVTTMGAATTTCDLTNTSGFDRTLLDVGATFSSTTAPFTGAFNFTVGTSTTPFVAPTNPLIKTGIAMLAGGSVITTTSTLRGFSNASVLPSGSTTTGAIASNWRTGEHLVWQSATATQTGYCRVSYY